MHNQRGELCQHGWEYGGNPRLRQRFDEASVWFETAADGAGQPGLKRRAREKVGAIKAGLKRQKRLQDDGEQNNDKRHEKQPEKKGNP